jgi:hypothetical protein
MSGPSIILDPQKMFNNLQELEKHTRDVISKIHDVYECLQQVAHLTFAIGFGELIKKAEAEINQGGAAVVAANNAVNTACKDVVNELVKKFASQGAKSDYGSPPFEHIHLKINNADRAAIYPQSMRTHFEDLLFSKFPQLALAFVTLNDDIVNTKHFWIGTSADRMRHNFDSKVSSEFIKLEEILHKIYDHGVHWIDETIKFEASLATP